jgi:hypothetical protein
LSKCQSSVIRQEPAYAGEPQGVSTGKCAAAPGGVAADSVITNGLIVCRFPGGSGDRPFHFGELPTCPEGDGGFLGTGRRLIKVQAAPQGRGVGGEMRRYGMGRGIRPLAGCRAVMSGKRNGYGVWE